MVKSMGRRLLAYLAVVHLATFREFLNANIAHSSFTKCAPYSSCGHHQLMTRDLRSKPYPHTLSLRGGRKVRDPDALKKKAEDFWIPVIDRLSGPTRAVWESVIWDLIDAESKGEWGRIEPGEPEDDVDEEILDMIHTDPEGNNQRNSHEFYGNAKARQESAKLAEQMLKGGPNSSEVTQRWWDSVDRDNVDRELLVEWFEETTCCGSGPLSWQFQRFGGEVRRCRAHYISDNETDEQMILRHFAGEETNETLAGLRQLKIAARCLPPPRPRRPRRRPRRAPAKGDRRRASAGREG